MRGIIQYHNLNIFKCMYYIFRPYICLLGRIPGTDIYKDIKVYEEVINERRHEISNNLTF